MAARRAAEGAAGRRQAIAGRRVDGKPPIVREIVRRMSIPPWPAAGRAALLAATLAASAAGGELAGQQLLVTSVRTGDTEVFVVDPETGDARNLSRSPTSEDRYPCWSPDAREVAFISDRDGAPNLYVMDARGDDVRRLTRTPAVCYMPSWVGGVIVFGMHGDKPEIARIRPDGTGLQVLGDGHDPSLSPDGRTIAYTGDVEGGFAVFVMGADGQGRRRLVSDTNALGAVFPSFSPDGRQVVYSGTVGQALELFVVAASGGEPRQLTRLGQVATPAAWSPDGRFISFRLTDEMYWRDKERMRQVYAEKPADKRPVWVVRPDGSGARVIESLRFQCAIDGSRAAWRPLAPPPVR